MFTHTIVRQVSNGASPIGASFVRTAGGEANVDETIPFGSTDLSVAFAINAAKLVSIILISTLADITVETNSGSSPANVFALKAGVPLVWTNQDGAAFRDTSNVVLANITSLFVTNPSVDTASVLQIRALVDPT
jgi:hypothetical protein